MMYDITLNHMLHSLPVNYSLTIPTEAICCCILPLAGLTDRTLTSCQENNVLQTTVV